jgi:hypothetical protein
MAFQSTIRQFQADGMVGDIALDGPVRAAPVVLKTTTAANNVIGRAFTLVSGQDGQAVAGGTGVFGGILINSKLYALRGAAGGALAPTLALANEVPVELCSFASGIFVSLTTSANVGDQVVFATADGQLAAIAPGASPGVGQALVPNAQVIRQNTSAAGLAMISLGN